MSVVHRVRLPLGASPLVDPGHQVEPAEVLATRRSVEGGTSIPIAARLRRSASEAATSMVAAPGAVLEPGDRIAVEGDREVTAPRSCIFLGYDSDEGNALVAPLGAAQPILGHVRGVVDTVTRDAIEIRVAGAVVAGVGGSGSSVHGPLHVAVRDPADELRASSIDVAATGRIVVGGSRASAETLTRARAMGVAGIVLGGVMDKDLRDFEATQARRRETGGVVGDFAILVVEGYGKVGMDAALFAWFREHDGHLASLFGDSARLYVYDADPPPGRRQLPRPTNRVVAHRRPHAGAAGELVRVIEGLHASPSGVIARAGLVRFDDGRTAIVPLANLEALESAENA